MLHHKIEDLIYCEAICKCLLLLGCFNTESVRVNASLAHIKFAGHLIFRREKCKACFNAVVRCFVISRLLFIHPSIVILVGVVVDTECDVGIQHTLDRIPVHHMAPCTHRFTINIVKPATGMLWRCGKKLKYLEETCTGNAKLHTDSNPNNTVTP